MAGHNIVLITGANTGLGYEIVRALCASEQAYEILLGGRSIEKAKKASEDAKVEFPQTPSILHPVQIDIEDDDSINALFDHVQKTYGRVDTLINNAGAQFDRKITSGAMTMRQAWTTTWNVNVVGTQVMTHTFVPLLLASSDPRLIFMASGTSSLALSENMDLPINRVPEKGWPKGNRNIQGNLPAYRSAKTGLNMMMREWFRFLKEDGVKIWGVSPGFLATGLGGDAEELKKLGAMDPSIGGHFVKDVVQGKRDEDVGKVIWNAGKMQPW